MYTDYTNDPIIACFIKRRKNETYMKLTFLSQLYNSQ